MPPFFSSSSRILPLPATFGSTQDFAGFSSRYRIRYPLSAIRYPLPFHDETVHFCWCSSALDKDPIELDTMGHVTSKEPAAMQATTFNARGSDGKMYKVIERKSSISLSTFEDPGASMPGLSHFVLQDGRNLNKTGEHTFALPDDSLTLVISL